MQLLLMLCRQPALAVLLQAEACYVDERGSENLDGGI